MVDTCNTAPQQLRLLVLSALFAAASAAVGYMLIMVPNVEAFSAFLFIGGYALGSSYGVSAAVIASLMYFGFNPQGGVFPPLLAAQIAGASMFAVAGSMFKRFFQMRAVTKSFLNGISLSLTAAVVTLIYDLVTNIAYPLTTGQGFKGIVVVLAAGIPFSAVHLLSNMVIFYFLVPPLLELVRRHRLIQTG